MKMHYYKSFDTLKSKLGSALSSSILCALGSASTQVVENLYKKHTLIITLFSGRLLPVFSLFLVLYCDIGT